MKRIFIIAILAALFLCACAPEATQTPEATEPGVTQGVTAPAEDGVDAYAQNGGRNTNYLCGIDQFGRTFMPVSGINGEKQVGMYYFLWHGMDVKMTGLYNITEILKDNPEDLWNIEGTDKSPVNKFHYWDEPLFGYYRSTDRWVIAKHIEMLTAAGVDFLYLDATNADPYFASCDALFSVLKSFYNAGWDAPKVVFYTNSLSILTINRIYEHLYTNKRYDDIWYRPDGVHPMIIGNATVESDKAEAALRGDTSYNPEPLSKEIVEFFDIRSSQWPNQSFITDGIPWMEWLYPQPVHNGVISVSVAQHPNLPFSDSINNRGLNWGRGFDFKTRKNIAENSQKGTNFQSQWDTVMDKKDRVHTVTVTGWNEWTAIKLIENGRVYFVDTAVEEFSRDIEPQRNGGYEDAFYLQLCDNIRRFKGENKPLAKADSATIDVSGDISQWDGIRNVYYTGCEKGYKRNSKSVADVYTYTQDAPRNNIGSVKVTNDGENLYFLVQAENNLVSADSADFINIYIGADDLELKGWEGYEFVAVPSQKALYALDKNGARTKAADISVSISGQYLQVSIALKDVGAQSGVYFKVADNVSSVNIMDTYTEGKCLPMGRLSWYYYLSE